MSYLTSRHNDEKLDFASISKRIFFSKSFDDGQWEGHSFTWARSVSSNEIFALKNMFKSLVLYWEESFDAFIL